MPKPWEDASFNEETITDMATARLALRWSLDRIRALQDENLRVKQSLQDKGSQIVFLDNQIKNKTFELQKIIQTHHEETQSRRDSLEYQLKSRMERASAKERELEDRLSQLDDSYRTKEIGLMAQYQKKSDELRARWSQVEAELWQVRQDNLLKQQEIEKTYKATAVGERLKLEDDLSNHRAALEKDYQSRLIDLERREQTLNEEMRKQEAVFKWAKASWEKDVESKEKALKGRELTMEKEGLEKGRQVQDSMFKIEHLEKQLQEIPEILKKRDTELDRYRTALESLESVVRSLESEKRSMQEQFNTDAQELNSQIVGARTRYAGLESEIPKRLKMAVEHERSRFEDRLSQAGIRYQEDVEKKEEEIQHLETILKSFQEMSKNLEAEKKSLYEKHEQLNAQYSSRIDEFHLREKQLESEYSVRVKVEVERNVGQLRDEMETRQKIYEESLKRRQEEITRLGRDSDAQENEKKQLHDKLRQSRRGLDEVREKHENDMAQALTEERNRHEKKLSEKEQENRALNDRLQAEIQKQEQLDVDSSKHLNQALAQERQRWQKDFEHQSQSFHSVIKQREDEMERIKTVVEGLEEEKKRILIEERTKHRDEIKMRDEKIATHESAEKQWRPALDAAKEGVKEAQSLARAKVSELDLREKTFGDMLHSREKEIMRLRQQIETQAGEKRELIACEKLRLKEEGNVVMKNLEEIIRAREDENARLKVLSEDMEKQLNEISGKYARAETEFQTRLQSAVLEESGKFQRFMDKKEDYIKVLKEGKEHTEESYRRDLENVRERVRGTVKALEEFKALADERQRQIDGMQSEMALSEKESSKTESTFQREIKSKEDEATTLKSGLREINCKAENAETEKNRLQAQLEKQVLISAGREDEITTLESEREKLHLETRKAKTENIQLKTGLRDLSDEKNSIAEKRRKTLEERKNEVETLKSEIEKLHHDIGDMKFEKNRLGTRMQMLEDEKEAAVEKQRRTSENNGKLVAGLKEEIDAMETEFQARINDIAERERRRSRDLTRRMQDAQSLLSEKEAELEEVQRAVDSLSNECVVLRERERELRVKYSKGLKTQDKALLKETEKKLHKSEDEISFLRVKFRTMESERDDLLADETSIRSGMDAPASQAGDLEELVFGVAHQMRNPLGIIQSHAQFCLDSPGLTKETTQSLEAVLRGISQMEKRLEEISDFARPIELKPLTAGLDEIMDATAAVISQRCQSQNIEIRKIFQRGLKPVKIDPARIKEAMLHIALNAVEAMPDGGTLIIGIARDPVRKMQKISISDTGAGISSKHLSAVFQPFFTTKPHGVGLGVPIAKRILRAHSGDVSIDSVEGKGTTVECNVPES